METSKSGYKSFYIFSQMFVNGSGRNFLQLNQPCEEPRLDISKCKHSSKHWSYHKIAFNSQKAKIWTKVKSFDQFHEN